MWDKFISFIRTEEQREPTDQALIILAIASSAGLVGIVLFSLQATSVSQFFSILGVGFLISGASLFLGGIVGFLFGIPRLTPPGWKPNDNVSAEIATPSPSYQENTNLEQISDWLTKIIVGVALTQVVLIQGYLQTFAEAVKPALGNFDSSGMFGIAILVYFSIDGFLIGYLWTRLFMEEGLTRKKMEILKLRGLEEEEHKDAEALKLMYALIRPERGASTVSQEELNKKISAASDIVKRLVFYSAVTFRQENRIDKRMMERVIPLFRALIHSEKERRYHQNHAQLGIALKDKCEPNFADWTEAEKELSTAIEIRGQLQDRSLDYYEYHRAICRINLDENYVKKPSQQASEQTKERILKDLEYASREYSVFIQKDDTINDWLRVNGIDNSRFNPIGSAGSCIHPEKGL